MDDSLAEVIRLLRLAQAGQSEQALVEAEEHLDVEESPGMRYVSALALHCMGDHEAAAAAAEAMLAIANDDAGWQSIALTGQVRATDLVARLGGDEFVAVVEGMDRARAGALAARIIDAVSTGLGSRVSVSVGVATGPASEAGTALLRSADRAMYAAKRANRIALSGVETLPLDDQSRTA